MKENISSVTFNSQHNITTSSRNMSFSTADSLEFNLMVATCPSKMEDISSISEEMDFHKAFTHLSRKAQHLFRILQNWTYLECYPSQTLLAKMIGCTRKHVNYLLKILSKIGFIDKHYRHRQTCLYFIKNIFKKLTWENTKKALLKPPTVTPKVTPSPITPRDSLFALRKRGKPKEKPPNLEIAGLPWLPRWDLLKEKYPSLAYEIFEDEKIYHNLAAYPQHMVERALESLYYAQQKPGYILTTHAKYLFGALKEISLKETKKLRKKGLPKFKPNWSLVMKLREKKNLA